MQKAKKYFKTTAILYIVLLSLIYLGSYLKYLLNSSWYATASVIAVIFIWVTIFTIATIIATKGMDVLKQESRGKERLDFVAKLGTLIAEYKRNNHKIEILEFFQQVCNENGVMDVPDLNKYYNKNKNLTGTRDVVFDKLRQEIEYAADRHSKSVSL